MSRHRRPLIQQSQPRPNVPAPRVPQSATVTKGTETITTLANGDIEEVTLDDIASRDGGECEPAVDFDDLAEQAKIGPPVKHYIVTRGGRVQTNANGQRATISQGKQLDDLNFDIQLMRRQGIEMREVQAGDSLDPTG